MNRKYIFVVGGVISGIGKGVVAASTGTILKSTGKKISVQKLDPYINVDPGTMSPFEHGECFVTKDGKETDLDLGHYERFIDIELNRHASVTSGQIYESVIKKERRGGYDGATIQVIPHITSAIKDEIIANADEEQSDVAIIEIGGTVGDIELQPFLEVIRQMKLQFGSENVAIIQVVYVPFIKAVNEWKTKPAQHSVARLSEHGVFPNVIVTRSDEWLEPALTAKLARMVGLHEEAVVQSPNVDNILKIPAILESQKIHDTLCNDLKIESITPDISELVKLTEKIDTLDKELNIGIVAKYVALEDSYLSVLEALKSACWAADVKLKVNWIDAEKVTYNNAEEILGDCDGILVPGGFGSRGTDGKIAAINYARLNNVPFFGICLGLQLATIEFARNVVGLTEADSTEWNATTPDPIIYVIEGKETFIGGTQRLGNFEATLGESTLAREIYGAEKVLERHRHRFEVNNKYVDLLQENGFVFSGINEENNLVEMIELPTNDFFFACQAHPEFKSRPLRPQPIFREFIKAAKKHNEVN